MKFLDEYRDAERVRRYADAITQKCSQPWTLMEICGGQTHTIVRYGLDELLPPQIDLIHGPGCPVCVTPIQAIDQAHQIAAQEGVIFCSFGDMLRVPGSETDLLAVKARGADIRTVYSPLDAVTIAQENPLAQVVFFAVGFETTAPANAMAVRQADLLQLDGFSVLVSHVLVPPAMALILDAPDNRVSGFLAAGHVCTVMGYEDYEPIARKYQIPIVVTGFEPVDLMQGILMCVEQLEAGTATVQNQYARVVEPAGNLTARALVEEVFEVGDRAWRGIGPIKDSGLQLRPHLRRFDARQRFACEDAPDQPPAACRAGEVLTGTLKPADCPAFGTRCTPDTPLGAPMVSSEGACAAYYTYRTGAQR